MRPNRWNPGTQQPAKQETHTGDSVDVSHRACETEAKGVRVAFPPAGEQTPAEAERTWCSEDFPTARGV
jgi:hypothetical protein